MWGVNHRLRANCKRAALLSTARLADGEAAVGLSAYELEGVVDVLQPNGKTGVKLTSTVGGGGSVSVYNKTGGRIVNVSADDYGNGVVGAYNRKGKGRTLKPGP